MNIDYEKIKRLELIRTRLENIPKERRNGHAFEDMLWLAEELRKAYLLLEKLEV